MVPEIYREMRDDGKRARLLLAETVGPLLYLTLNRPEKLNAINEAMFEELEAALESAEGNDNIRVVVLRGAGRAFSAGNDHGVEKDGGDGIPRTEADPIADRARLVRALQRTMRIWDFPKPIIAQIHGYCLGPVCRLVAVCDLTIVAENAQIGEPRALIGGAIIAPSWVHLVGPRRAKEMSFGVGTTIDGVTAAAWGWANRAVPADQLDAEVRELALRIAEVPPQVLAVKKAAINRVVEAGGFRHALMAGAEMDTLIHLSPEVVAERDLVREVGIANAAKRRQQSR